MHRPRYLHQLIFTTLIFLASSCVPATQATPYPKSLPPVKTETPSSTSTATKSPDPNNVSPELLITPTPDPNAFTISAEINQNYSKEEIAKILFSKWLDHFMDENISPARRLDEYTINSINLPIDQKCARKSGGIFVAEAEVTMKTTLPLASPTSNEHSDWTAGGGNLIDSYHELRLFSGVIYQSGNNYTLEVIMQTPMCE